MELERQRVIVAWTCFLIGLALIVIILTTSGCQTTPMPPPIDVKFWAGDSDKEGISRSQDKATLQCKDPRFDEYACVTYEDLQKIYDTMMECEKWPKLVKVEPGGH